VSGITWVDIAGTVGVVLTVIGTIVVAIVSRMKDKYDSASVSAVTISELMESISAQAKLLSELRVELESERAKRRELEERIGAILLEHEDKMAKQAQAHRDRVYNLKMRIKTLEDNGVGGNPEV